MHILHRHYAYILLRILVQVANLLDVFVVFRARLEELDADFLGEGTRVCGADHFLAGRERVVVLVAHEDPNDLCGGRILALNIVRLQRTSTVDAAECCGDSITR